jgi:four helix bundle protein
VIWGYGDLRACTQKPQRVTNQQAAETAVYRRRGGNMQGPLDGRSFAPTVLMETEELKSRTRQFGLNVIDLCLTLGFDDFAQLIRPQLLRSGTGVAANHRSACRSRSRQEFASRLADVVEEADESELWLDYLQVRKREPIDVISDLRSEAIELRAIFARSRSTALKRIRERRKAKRHLQQGGSS